MVRCIVGISVRMSDGNAAIGRMLLERGIQHRAHDNALIVRATAAGGVVVRFLPAAGGLSEAR